MQEKMTDVTHQGQERKGQREEGEGNSRIKRG